MTMCENERETHTRTLEKQINMNIIEKQTGVGVCVCFKCVQITHSIFYYNIEQALKQLQICVKCARAAQF